MELMTPSFGLIFWALFLLIPLVLWLIALIDVLRSELSGQDDKLIRVLVTVFIPVLGTVLYFAIGRKNKVKLNQY